MAGSLPAKAKRKELDDELSGFSLFSPATKIRRLDADMLSVKEENEPIAALRFNQQLPLESASTSGLPETGTDMACDMPAYLPNEAGGLVIYNAVDSRPLLPTVEPNISFKVSPDFIRGLKNHVLKLGDQTIFNMDDKIAVYNNCLALVPWVPSQATVIAYEFAGPESKTELPPQSVEAEEAEVISMEIEDNTDQAAVSEVDVNWIQQWQQHCMTPQLMPNTPSTILW